MRQRLVVYSGHVEVIEYPCVVVQDSVLVKPIYVYLGDIERAVVSGRLLTPRPIAMGASGVVRVVEVMGSHSVEYTGKVYSVTPIGSHGVLGVHENGLLANFISIHPSHLDEQLLNPTPLDAIRPVVKHSVELAQIAEEPVLVEGCGLVGVSTGIALRRTGVEPLFYCEELKRNALNYGFTVAQHISEVSRKWNSVVLTSTNISSKYKVLANLDYEKLLVSRLSFTSWIPLKSSASRASVVIVNRGDRAEVALIKQVLSELGKAFRVLTLNTLEDSVGLIPPRGLGVIVSLAGQ